MAEPPRDDERDCFRGERRPVVRRPAVRWIAGAGEGGEPHAEALLLEEAVAVEEPLEIRLCGEPLAVTMRTPGNDEELAVGFCLTEGIVRGREDFADRRLPARRVGGNVIDVVLRPDLLDEADRRVLGDQRALFMSSSCGVCGKRTIERLLQRSLPAGRTVRVAVETLADLPNRMRAAQRTFDATGGLHAAAWFSATGELRCLREDVGRHNAVDKVLGAELLAGRIPADDGVLLVSGRTSFEILQKAALAGVQVLAAVSAPSSLAVDFAARRGITLVGFLRPGRMNVYWDCGRIVAAPNGLPTATHAAWTGAARAE